MWSHLLPALPRALRRHLIMSKLRIDDARLHDVQVKLAETEQEIFGAARLVHDAYVARGLLPTHETHLHFAPESAAPGAWTFVAVHGTRTIATMSLTCDSERGVPMDTIYRDELSVLRCKGARLAEVGSFAVDPDFRGSGIALWLNRIVIRTAMRLGVDHLVVAVHPRAEDLYREIWRFERVGDERVYPGLNEGARAVAMSRHLPTFAQELFRSFGHLGPSARNVHWLVFTSELPQITEPARLDTTSPRRRTLRKAIARARPDLVSPRASLVSVSNEGLLG